MATVGTANQSAPRKTLSEGGTVCAIAKFIKNGKTTESEIISRTFGKVAVIDRQWQKQVQDQLEMPQVDEFWFVDVVRDTGNGTNKGVLIVRPRFKLEPKEECRLLPNAFEVEADGILYVRPKHPGPLWILGLNLKETLLSENKNCNAVITVVEEPEDAVERAKKVIKKKNVTTSSPYVR